MQEPNVAEKPKNLKSNLFSSISLQAIKQKARSLYPRVQLKEQSQTTTPPVAGDARRRENLFSTFKLDSAYKDNNENNNNVCWP